MAHHIYHTPAFILGGYDHADANRYIELFTRELGFLRARAQSVRREESKLRYALQPYTLSDIALVRGREVWRITGAVERINCFHALRETPNKLAMVYNITALLRRLLQGEEKHERLFDVFAHALQAIQERAHSDPLLKAIEYIAVYRLLVELGYLESLEQLGDPGVYSDDVLVWGFEHRKKLVRAINHALNESQL